jgi:hypothetical protein
VRLLSPLYFYYYPSKIMLFDALALAAMGACGWLGYSRGIVVATAALLETAVALVLAVLMAEPLSSFLADGMAFFLGPMVPLGFPFTGWALFLTFGILSWGILAAIRFWLHTQSTDDDNLLALADQVGGGVMGCMTGYLLAGGAMVTLSMLPIFNGLKPVPAAMIIDPGAAVLSMGGRFAPDHYEGRSIAVFGEPIVMAGNPAALLTDEPWFDVDEDSAFTDADRLDDLDGNGTLSESLYFLDLDQDRTRRLGLLDKYAVGCWHYAMELKINDRGRAEDTTEETDDSSDEDSSANGVDESPSTANQADPRPSEPSPQSTVSPTTQDPDQTTGERDQAQPTESSTQPKFVEPVDDF